MSNESKTDQENYCGANDTAYDATRCGKCGIDDIAGTDPRENPACKKHATNRMRVKEVEQDE